jgi:hypothetical protein
MQVYLLGPVAEMVGLKMMVTSIKDRIVVVSFMLVSRPEEWSRELAFAWNLEIHDWDNNHNKHRDERERNKASN